MGTPLRPQPGSEVGRRRVVSAGGVVLRLGRKGLDVLLVTLRKGAVWSLPKGQVEPGERYAETAVREVREETSVEARILTPLGRIRYHFTVRDEVIPVAVTKEVHYFLMRYVAGEPKPQLAEVEGAEWVPVREALARLSYANEREMLNKALSRWEKPTRSLAATQV